MDSPVLFDLLSSVYVVLTGAQTRRPDTARGQGVPGMQRRRRGALPTLQGATGARRRTTPDGAGERERGGGGREGGRERRKHSKPNF